MNKLSIFKISLVIFILTIAIFLSFSENYSTKGNTQDAFPNIIQDFQNVSKISLESKSGEFFLIRNAEEWGLQGYNNYPADIKKINNFLLQLSNSSILDIKETDKNNYYKLGVSYPLNNEHETTRIKFFNNDEVIYDFIIGKDTSKNINYNVNYFRNTKENLVLLFKNELNIFKEALSWIDTEIIKIGRWRIKEVSINDLDSKSLLKVYRDDYSSQTFKFYNLPKEHELINNYSHNSLVSVFEGINIIDVIPQIPNSNRKQLKINKRIQLTTFDGLVLYLELVKIDKDQYVKINVSSNENIRQELPKDSEKIIGIPNMKSFKEVEKEKDRIKFAEKWLYKFDKNSFDQFNKSKKDFIQKKSN